MGTKIQFSSIGIIFSIAQEKRIIVKKTNKESEFEPIRPDFLHDGVFFRRC
tara:strand:- start:668 stop:820 length:153 start_codon:yes stop_codon:yes gene_type:complete